MRAKKLETRGQQLTLPAMSLFPWRILRRPRPSDHAYVGKPLSYAPLRNQTNCYHSATRQYLDKDWYHERVCRGWKAGLWWPRKNRGRSFSNPGLLIHGFDARLCWQTESSSAQGIEMKHTSVGPWHLALSRDKWTPCAHHATWRLFLVHSNWVEIY